jgi:hypothetical protein
VENFLKALVHITTTTNSFTLLFFVYVVNHKHNSNDRHSSVDTLSRNKKRSAMKILHIHFEQKICVEYNIV